jgi:hypothetical protein
VVWEAAAPLSSAGSRAAKEPFTFHQALAPGGRAAQATGMNQWMPCRPQGARSCQHGVVDGVGRGVKAAYWAVTTQPGWTRLGSPTQGKVFPVPLPPPPTALPPLWLARAG